MGIELTINQTKIQLEITDITDLEIESFVYYATEDLKLGSGFGTSISIRGGATIQEELNNMAPASLTEAVVSSAGNLKAEYIIHAVGPKFQEEDIENKLATTVANVLKVASEKEIKNLAMPAMGAGFYGIPIETSAKITIHGLKGFFQNNSSIQRVVLCMLDSKQYKNYEAVLKELA